jgi:hypothetical protein
MDAPFETFFALVGQKNLRELAMNRKAAESGCGLG